MLGSGINLITTVIGFGLSATFIVFVCTRLIYVRLRRMQARQMPRIDLELGDRRINGVEPVTIGGTPTEKFNLRSTYDTLCTICLAEYQEKEMLRVMPKCGHSFHLSCIDIWLRKHSTCPVCRLPIQDSTTSKHLIPSANRSEISMEHSRRLLLPTMAAAPVEGQADSVSAIGRHVGLRPSL